MSFFPQTAWTVIVNAGQGSSPDLETFCRAYRQPIYSFARAKGLTHEDAEDLTQMFFASLLRRGLLEKADPAVGRLRNYLLRHFSFVLRDYFKARNAVSRGSQVGFVPLTTTFCDVPDPAAAANVPLVTETMLQEVTAALQQEYEHGRQEIPFAELKAFLPAFDVTERPSYEALTHKYPGVSAPALRKRVSRLREDFKRLLLAKVPELQHYTIKPRRDAEARFERTAGPTPLTPETIFNREWATCVLEDARRRLRSEYNRKFPDLPFQALEAVFRGEEPDYAAIQGQHPNLSQGAIQERAAFLQQRLVEIRNAIVASTVADEAEVPDEIRELDQCWQAA